MNNNKRRASVIICCCELQKKMYKESLGFVENKEHNISKEKKKLAFIE